MAFQAATGEDYRHPWAAVVFVVAVVEGQLIPTLLSSYLGAERRRTVPFERGP
jgi:hypothetical protein